MLINYVKLTPKPPTFGTIFEAEYTATIKLKAIAKIVLPIAVWFIANPGIAQEIDVVFEKVVHDFGNIAENGGYVGYNFLLVNNGEEALFIDSAQVSCGCMVPQWPDKSIAPKDTGEIALIYDPMGRPGQFTKSLAVYFSTSTKQTTRYLNVKGYVVASEVAEDAMDQYLENQEIIYDFQIKPINIGFTRLDSFNITTSGFNQFLNDITYVIDQDGFANVVIDVEFFGNSTAARSAGQIMVKNAKEAIVAGLTRRGYPDYSVGIITHEVQLSDEAPEICPVCVGIITFSSQHYNNDFLEESLILPLEDMAVLKDSNQLSDTIFTAPGSFGYWHITGDASKFKFSKHKDDYKQFIRSLVLLYLDMGQIDIGIKIGLNTLEENWYNGRREMEDIGVKFYTQILTDLVEEGVSEEAIFMRVNTVQLFNIGNEEKYNFVQFVMYPHEEEKDDNTAEYVPENPVIEDHIIELPHSNLPVYQLSFSGEGNKQIDTTSAQFIAMMDSVIAAINKGETVKLLIESSASKTPTNEVWDNHYVSLKRAQETEETITTYMLSHGVSQENIQFDDHVTLVQGPEYRRDVYPIGFYKQFQYLRVIPFYEPQTNNAKQGLVPYMINFGEAQTQISSFSPIFERFVKSMLPILEEQGYIKIILEASASRLPATSYKSNDILAFYRAHDAKAILLHTVATLGGDASRVIVVEQHALVQGPPYNEDVDTDKTAYEKYQYIKIIPEALIRE